MSVVVVRLYSFECDCCGRVHDVVPARDKSTAREARRLLRLDGWLTGPPADVCRPCRRRTASADEGTSR